MAEKYARINWKDSPSTETPINAENLNKMDEGIEKAHEELKYQSKTAIISFASGTAITTTDAANVPPVNLKVFGKSVQDGTPTPDNPIEIESVGDGGSVVSKISGSQLFDVSLLDKQTYITVDEDGWITINNTGASTFYTQTEDSMYINGDYVVSAEFKSGSTTFYMQTSNSDYKNSISSSVTSRQVSTTDFGRIMFAVGAGESVTFKIMVNVGSTTLSWEPYKEPQNLTHQTPNGLPGIEVTDSSIATYTDSDGKMWCADEIDLKRGKYMQRVNRFVIDSNTSVYADTNIFYCKLPVQPIASDRLAFLCSHYKNAGSTENKGDNAYINLSIPAIVFYDSRTKDEIVAWLADNPITVQYILAEPIETDLTTEEIEQFKALVMNYPNNTLLNNAGAYTELEYVVDTKMYVDKSQNSSDCAKKTDIPTKTSQLTNDSGFITGGGTVEITSDAPANENTVLTIDPSAEEVEIYTATELDNKFSQYMTSEEVKTYVDSYINEALNGSY